MLFGKTIAVSCDSHRKHTKTWCGEYSGIFNFKGYWTLQELPSYRRDSRQVNLWKIPSEQWPGVLLGRNVCLEVINKKRLTFLLSGWEYNLSVAVRRQCTYKVTLVRSRTHCCYGNATVHSLYIVVVDVHVAINNRTADCCHANARMHSLGTPVELHSTSYFCLQYKCTELLT
jgi:hypothetical protein